MTLDAEAMPDNRIEATTVVRASSEKFSNQACRHGTFLSLGMIASFDAELKPDQRSVVIVFRRDIHIVVIPLGKKEVPTPVGASELGTVGFVFLVCPPSFRHD